MRPVNTIRGINKDFIAVVPSWERDQKTRATHYLEQVGGPVPVALTAAARLGGVECVHLGVVGDDREADDVADALTEQRVEILTAPAELCHPGQVVDVSGGELDLALVDL